MLSKCKFMKDTERGRKSVSTETARKSFLIKSGDCVEIKRPFWGKKCRINVEEVEMFCEIFFLLE